MQMSTMLNSFSVMIWGMVLAKAKKGMKAAESDNHITVKKMLRQATTLILLVCVASFAKFGAEMSQKETFVASRHPTLKAAHSTVITEEVHSDSFYDPNSSHYMGGAHNVALMHITDPDNVMLKKVKSKSMAE